MKTLFAKTTETLSSVMLVVLGCAAAGLGLMVVGFLGLFALAALGLAMIAAPFVAAASKQASA